MAWLTDDVVAGGRDHLVATCNDIYIVYDYDKKRRRRVRGLKAVRVDKIIPLHNPQEFAETLLRVIADAARYNASLED